MQRGPGPSLLECALNAGSVRGRRALAIHAFVLILSHGLHDILVEYANQTGLFLSAIFQSTSPTEL